MKDWTEMLEALLEIGILAAALSIDAFGAGFAYGISKTKIPLISGGITAGISSLMLILSILAGNAIGQLVPSGLTEEVCFCILFLLGVVKLFQKTGKKEAQKADRNGDKRLSPPEAAVLGFALSVDSIAAGVGVGIQSGCLPETFCISLAAGAAAIYCGSGMGSLLSEKSRMDLSWLSGALLILLAVMKLF